MATLFDYFQAIRSSDARVVTSTLASGKWGVNFQNAYGQSAVHIATIYNQPEMIQLLVGHSARLDLHDSQGHTPLHLACRNAHFGPEHLETVRLLLRLGADPSRPTTVSEGELRELPMYREGRLPLDCAAEKDRDEVAALLRDVSQDDALLTGLREKHGGAPLNAASNTNGGAASPAPVPAPAPPTPVVPSAPTHATVAPAPIVDALPVDLGALPKDALMFVGQGTQFVGMARDLLEKDGPGKAVFARASAILGYDVGELCLRGPEAQLQSTAFSQTAVMVSSLAALEELKAQRPNFMDSIGHVAGFSLGEITALVAADLIDFEAGVRLVKARAEAMQAAAEANPGGMASITGLEDAVLDEIIAAVQKETGGRLVIANFLFPKGRVVSGDIVAVDAACAKATARKALNAKRLVVGGAFHSEHMALARDAVAKVLADIEIRPPTRALYSNVTGRPYESVKEIQDLLVLQVVSPVQWQDTVQALAATGGRIYEVGAGEQLKAMVRRVDVDAWRRVENIGHWLPPKPATK